MKHLILTLTIIFTTQLLAQNKEAPKIGDYVTFSFPIQNSSENKNDDCNSTNTELIINESDVCYFDKNIIFQVIDYDVSKSKYKLLALPFKEKNKSGFGENSTNKIDKAKAYNNIVYSADSIDVLHAYKNHEFRKKLHIGFLSLPFKIRYKDDWSFETEIKIGAALSYRLWSSNFFVQFGYQIGKTTLTSENSNLLENNSVSAATLSLVPGIIYEYNNIQIGIYKGLDYINNQSKYDWKYHKEPWLSIGFGYNIFELLKNEKNG